MEVGNTDAEGRLALADAMSFVQHHHKPHTVIDAATLTGNKPVLCGSAMKGVMRACVTCWLGNLLVEQELVLLPWVTRLLACSPTTMTWLRLLRRLAT